MINKVVDVFYFIQLRYLHSWSEVIDNCDHSTVRVARKASVRVLYVHMTTGWLIAKFNTMNCFASRALQTSILEVKDNKKYYQSMN